MAATVAAAAASSLIAGAMNRSSNRAAANANNAAADAATQQAQISREQYDDWKTDFLPLQRQLAGEAKDAGGLRDQAIAAEGAAGDVGLAFGKAKVGLSQRLAGYGIDPSQGKYAANFTDMGLSEAAASAGAQTRARTNAIDRGRAFRTDVYGLGRGVPASASAGLASAAGTNSMIANNAASTASRNSAGVGALVQQGLNLWNSNQRGLAPPGYVAGNGLGEG